MTLATSVPGSRDRRLLRRRFLQVLSLAWPAVAAACHSDQPPRESPLAIGYLWPRQTETDPLETSTASVGPSEVLISWHPDKYSVADIQAVADQQCGSYRRAAQPVTSPQPAPPLLVQRFACVPKP